LVINDVDERGVNCCLNQHRTLMFCLGQHCRPPPISSKSWNTKLIQFKPSKSILNTPHCI
jgi:hypothetical protein